jgi:hypothetical protein
VVNRALMFYFLKRLEDKQMVIHNRIFEIRISKYIITKDDHEKKEKRVTGALQWVDWKNTRIFDVVL